VQVQRVFSHLHSHICPSRVSRNIAEFNLYSSFCIYTHIRRPLQRHILGRVETAIEKVTIEQGKNTQSLASLVRLAALEQQTLNPSPLEVFSQGGSTNCTFRCPVKVVHIQASRPSEKSLKMTRQKQQAVKASGVGHAVQVFTQKSIARCKEWCSCTCHKKNVVRMKDSGTIGSFSLAYSGLPWVTADCDQKSCRSRSVPSIAVTFQFPSWVWKRHLSTSLSYTSIQGPDLSFKLPRVVGWTSKLWGYGLVGDIAGIQALYSSRLASPWDVSPLGGSLLHYATDHEHWDLCKFLVDQHATIETDDDFNNSPAAIVWEKILMGKLTDNEASRMANIFSDTDFLETRGFTILHKIVLHLIPRTLESELEFSTEDLNATDSNGRTCVSWAAARGDPQALQALLRYGADPSLPDGQGSSPLHHASNVACINLLVNSAIDVSARNSFGRTPIHSLCRGSGSLRLLRRLTEIGVDINAIDRYGETALANATFNRHTACALYLLDHGADLNITNGADGSGDAPIHMAVMQNTHEILRRLLERGAAYTKTNTNGSTILHIAAQLADTETVECLKQHGLQSIGVSLLNHDGKLARDLLQARERDSESADVETRFEDLLRGIECAQGLASRGCSELEVVHSTRTTRLAGLDVEKDATIMTCTPVSIDDEGDDQAFEDEDFDLNPPVFFDAVEDVHEISISG